MKIELPHYIEEAIAEHGKLVESLENDYPGVKFASVQNLSAYIGERIIALYHSAKQKETEQCQQTTQLSADHLGIAVECFNCNCAGARDSWRQTERDAELSGGTQL
jgi:hypothetical protein